MARQCSRTDGVSDMSISADRESRSILHISHDACYGCGACAATCPQSCIKMKPDAEGFLHPTIEQDACIACGRCLQHCPASHTPSAQISKSPRKSFVAVSSNRDDLERCTSGGIVYELSRQFLETTPNGSVIGCALGPGQRVMHVSISKIDELVRLQGSKYVQSDMREAYDYIEHAIRSGNKVLFIGTPCQTHAIKLVFSTESVLTVDLFCHGVPSPLFWEHEVKHLIKRGFEPQRAWLFRLTSRHMRYRYALCDSGENAIDYYCDPYYSLFMNSSSLRESCYTCPYASVGRTGDISVGDCGTADAYPSFPLSTPLSSVLINTSRGEALFSSLFERGSIKVHPLDLEREVSSNKALFKPAMRPKDRDNVYRDLISLDYRKFSSRHMPRVSPIFRFKEFLKGNLSARAFYSLKHPIQSIRNNFE